ncbi:MAG: TPM domain-containing protein [Bacteroidetes bacterium]|nr:TPM domain-containing protein [Bacteroidota bacterium]
MSAKKFFSEDQKQAIQQAIANAELNTSGEIRVHIDDKCKKDVLDQAANLFHQLKMDATELRNGVLFYLAVDDHKFAILGDKGINEKVPADFWNTIKEEMLVHFKQQQFTEGLCKGIEMAGQKLKAHFPLQSDDTNELSNDVSFGN